MTGPAPVLGSQVLWTLALNHHAVNLALTAPTGQPVASTIQFSVTAFNAEGTPLPAGYTVHYSAADSSVTVSATGLATAHFATPGPPTRVIASATVQNITLSDTAFIQVTQTPLPYALATFSLQPAPGDSAKRAMGYFSEFVWPVRATDASGTIICDATACPLQVYYRSSNPLVAAIDRSTGRVAPQDTGHVVLTATTWVYGVPKEDSVDFRIGLRIEYGLSISGKHDEFGVGQNYFSPSPIVRLGVGARVTFYNSAFGHPTGVIFDTLAALVDTASTVVNPPTGAGNIPPFGGDSVFDIDGGIINDDNYFNSFHARRFPVAGVYRYHSTRAPTESHIIEIVRE